MGKYIIKTSDYVRDFRCIGTACPQSCCEKWQIIWSDSEIERLVGSAECTEQIRQIAQECFWQGEDGGKKAPDGYKTIKLDENGDCPFHDKSDRLCIIQKQMGAQYLSSVCTVFPNIEYANNGVLFKARSISCPAVFDLIAKSESAADVYTLQGSRDVELSRDCVRDTVSQVKEKPMLAFRNDIFDFFYDILSSGKRDYKTSVILGALAASKLSEFEQRGEYNRIPQVIGALKGQISSPATAASLSGIKPNYAVKLDAVAMLFQALSLTNDIVALTEDLRDKLRKKSQNEQELEAYRDMVCDFENMVSDKPFLMKNICRMLFYNMGIPFKDKRYTVFQNYALFVIAACAAEYLGVATAAKHTEKADFDAAFKRNVCAAARCLCHREAFVEPVIKYLTERNMLSAAHLALIIK